VITRQALQPYRASDLNFLQIDYIDYNIIYCIPRFTVPEGSMFISNII